MEIWKDIPGYEGIYQVSNFGNIKSFKGGKRGTGKEIIRKYTKNDGGYLTFGIEYIESHYKEDLKKGKANPIYIK